ncbi:Nur1p Ecym_5609 [Eremothecium cymbalariae DBVPG|uniref:Nuclear rim protein 1 n=1 Tax=Eremothecium cymbalariae (strain CBS 270.75 / DBVPG 7215 / KCTC 17166 / NRRL Y-17582) TaxID=931890 RepID=I6NE53_ERECY|nr:hypothetical protein Ecym_5609 [Eremothecium cymbalariae DBVPG\
MSFRVSRWEARPIDPQDVIQEEDEELADETKTEKTSWPNWTLQLLTSSPYDIYLMLNENIEVIDWNKKAKTLAWPLGSAMTFLFFSVRLLQDNLIKPNYHKINRSTDGFDFSRSAKLREYDYFVKYRQPLSWSSGSWRSNTLGTLDKGLKVTIVFLFLLNVTITYKFLFGYFQIYSMFYFKKRPNCNNVTKRSLHDLAYRYAEDVSRDSLWSMIKYVFFQRKKKPVEEISEDYYFEIRKWCPSIFLTALFTSFSPISVTFLIFSDVSFVTSLPLLLHQYLFWYIIFDRYENRIMDEQAIFSGTAAEINDKVMKPKFSIKIQDAMVDATTSGCDFVQFYPSYTTTRSQIFTTHSLKGDLIKEKFNYDSQRFEDTFMGDYSDNIIKPLRNERIYSGFLQHSHKMLNGAAIGALNSSRHPNYTRYGTPSPKHCTISHLPSATSAPTTPQLKYETNINTSVDYSNGGNMSRGNISYNDCAKADFRIEIKRRNSSSPLKKYLNNPSEIHHEENVTQFSVHSPEVGSLRSDDLRKRGRSPDIQSAPLRSSMGNLSRVSSRNSSVSPSKLLRHSSVDNRPPFR